MKCAQCGAMVDEPEGAPAEQRIPCPQCGSLAREHQVAGSLSANVAMSARGTVDRGVNDARLGVLGLIVGVGMGSAAYATSKGWEVALPVGIVASAATALLIRWRRSRHLLMELAHRLTGR